MSPLLLVGILATALADVSHVLQGSAHPPTNPEDINSLAYQSSNPKDFWWMADDSPLKGAFTFYKDCASKGNCLTQPEFDKDFNIDGLSSIDLAKNPFLNGELQSKTASASFKDGADSIDLANNPFLNGAFQSKTVPSSFTVNGEKVHDENGFLGVQPKKPGFATTHPLSNKKPFPTSPPIGQQSFVLGGDSDRVDETKCDGEGHACVTRELCINGVVNRKLVREITNINVCNADKEVCCRITDIENSPKFEITLSDGSKKSYSSSLNELVHADDSLVGASEFSSSSVKPTRSVNNVFGVTPDYSDVHFDSNVRFASSIQGPDYLPPFAGTTPQISTYKPFVPSTRPPQQCPPGSYLTAYGSCETPQVVTCPFGTIRKPDGTCESPETPRPCPPGTYKTSFGQCESPTTPSCPYGTIKQIDGSCKKLEPPTPRPCPPDTYKSASGQCITPTTPTPRPCPPGTYKSASGQCITRETPPTPRCPFGTVRQIDGSCSRVEIITTPRPCGPGTFLGPSGTCEPSGYEYTKPCPSGTYKSASGECLTPSIPPRPCPPDTYKSTSGQCIATSTPVPVTDTCPFGTILQIDGSCRRPDITTAHPCPPGTYKSNSGQCVSPPTPVPRCPFGTYKQIDGSCRKPEVSSTPRPCGPGTFLTSSGICEPFEHEIPKPCPPGTYKSFSGQCIRPSTPATTTESCPFGTIEQIDGSCRRPEITTSAPCGPGTTLGSSGLCEPSGYEYPTPTPRPCPFGTIKQIDGSCRQPETPAPRPCPPGTYKSVSGQCIKPSTPAPPCPFGTIKQIDGSCRQPETPPPRPCPPGTYKSASGQCIRPSTLPPSCPFGTIKQIDGSCRTPEVTSTPRPCSYGTILGPSGLCEPSNYEPTRVCPFGTVKQIDGSCRTPDIPTPRPCPLGTYKSTSGQCVTPATPAPRPFCPFGTVEQIDGSCKRPETSTPGYEYPKPCPPGHIKTASGECEKQCPFGTFKQVDGSCRRPEPPTPPCPPGTYRTSFGQCSVPPTPTPTCPFGTIRQPDGSCLKPTTSREYLPPTTPTPTRPGGYIYEKPTPTFGYPSTSLVPSQNSINPYYLPAPTEASTEDNTGEYANVNKFIIPSENNHETPAVGCAAALKCVQEIYCTADGFVSPVPVVLTPQQELLRAPTTVCKDLESGIIGKCCRDANYKDAWPSANLVNGVDDGQYKEDNFYGQRGINSNRLVRASNGTKSAPRATRRSGKYEPEAKCGERNLDTEPKGESPIDANFAEYPWQAMVLRDSNRSLLCGGAIIRKNAVLTSAHCVEGLETSDILIKGGEWKLGIDEEPLPFQIVKVAAILRHPEYKAGSYVNDLAVLVLQEKLRATKNIGTICLPQPNQIPTANCKVTGWGKRILQLHAKGALMHHIDVKIMDNNQCQQKLAEQFKDSVQNYSPNTLCGFSDIDQCRVDYGSALACANEQGQYTLSGIYSWDTGCKQEGQIGGYVAPDVEWIERTLKRSLKELRRLDRDYLLKST